MSPNGNKNYQAYFPQHLKNKTLNRTAKSKPLYAKAVDNLQVKQCFFNRIVITRLPNYLSCMTLFPLLKLCKRCLCICNWIAATVGSNTSAEENVIWKFRQFLTKPVPTPLLTSFSNCLVKGRCVGSNLKHCTVFPVPA